MNTNWNEILYKVIVVLTTASMIPGFIVGTVLYMLGALVFSIIGRDAVQDYVALYIFGIKEFIKHYKKNFWAFD